MTSPRPVKFAMPPPTRDSFARGVGTGALAMLVGIGLSMPLFGAVATVEPANPRVWMTVGFLLLCPGLALALAFAQAWRGHTRSAAGACVAVGFATIACLWVMGSLGLDGW